MATEVPNVETRVENATVGVHTNTQDLEQTNMAVILRGLQASLTKLATASDKQTAAFESLRDDIFLNTVDPTVEDSESVGNECDPSLDIQNTLDNVLEPTCVAVSDKVVSQDSVVSDSDPQNELLESQTQAFIPSVRKSPAIESKIAQLVDNMLTGDLSPATVKERVEKYPPPSNCEYLTLTTVNEEIWDLMSRKARSVELAFQRT